MKNIGVFIGFFFFLEVKSSIYLNRRVFVMISSRARGNFSQRTRHVASLRGRAG